MPVPRQMDSFQEFRSPAVTAAGASLPWMAFISRCLMQILFCSDFKYFPPLSFVHYLFRSPSGFLNPSSRAELLGGALQNTNFGAWAPSLKSDFFGLGWSPGISILSLGCQG